VVQSQVAVDSGILVVVAERIPEEENLVVLHIQLVKVAVFVAARMEVEEGGRWVFAVVEAGRFDSCHLDGHQSHLAYREEGHAFAAPLAFAVRPSSLEVLVASYRP
jgi:hypothetical protein